MRLFKDKIFIVLFIVFIFGLFLRVYNVTNYELNILESGVLDLARLDEMAFTEDLKWIYSHFFLYQDIVGEPMGEITSRIYYRLFGNSVISVRLNPLIIGSLTIFLLYFLFNLLLEERLLSFLASSLAYFSFTLIYFSRFAFQQFPMAFFYLLFTALSIALIKKPDKVLVRKNLFILSSAGSLVAGFLFHPLIIFAPLGLSIFIFFDWCLNHKSEGQEAKAARKVFLTVLAIFAASLSVIFPRQGLGVGISQSNRVDYLFGQTDFNHGFGTLLNSYLYDRFTHFLAKMKSLWDIESRGSFFDIMPYWIVFGALGGLARVILARKKEMLFFILMAALSFVGSNFIFTASTPFHRMHLPFIVFIYFLFGWGLSGLFKLLRLSRKVSATVFVLFIIAELIFSLNSMFWRSSFFFSTKDGADAYDSSAQIRTVKLIALLKQKNIDVTIGVDNINKGPSYHLRDYGFKYEFIRDDEFLNKTALPAVYISDYAQSKDEKIREIVLNYYDNILPGVYVIKEQKQK